jgi:hypothetical protein
MKNVFPDCIFVVVDVFFSPSPVMWHLSRLSFTLENSSDNVAREGVVTMEQ